MSTKSPSKEKQEWDELYKYVREKVLFYDEHQSLSKNMILRLRGLATGKLIANNKIKNRANYSYKIVLLTFKFCSMTIQKAIARKSFDSEQQKFNYICAIVENNLNEVYTRIQRVEKVKAQMDVMDVNTLTHNSAGYTKKTKETSKKLNSLW